MKKLLFAIAIACVMQVAAYAQKSDAEMQKGVDKALAACQDAKKAAKGATWLNLAKAYVMAYTNPTSSVVAGLDRANWDNVSKEKPVAEEVVTLSEGTFTKLTYSHIDVYFNEMGVLAFAVVTKPSVEGDLLKEAANAYVKAYELGAKSTEIDPKIQELVNYYNTAAYAAYTTGDYKKASQLFKGAADVSYLEPCSAPADDSAYNAALIAVTAQDYDTALEYYKICLAKNYGENGDIYARLSDVYGAIGDKVNQKAILEEGFAKYPENQAILIGLINFAENNGEDPNYVLALLDKAKENDPNNASIYAVQGNILAQMKRYDEAEAVFAEAVKVDPAYNYAYYAWGKMWYERAVEFQVAADELPLTAPQREYDAIIKNRDNAVQKCIEPLEKCFNQSEEMDYKVACAEYLRRAYYQLSNSTNDYKAKSDSYKEFVESNQ